MVRGSIYGPRPHGVLLVPKYNYICDSCESTWEERVSKFEPRKVCPRCGVEGLRQAYGFKDVYKGPGFYTTDSRGITGKKRKPKIKTGLISDLPPDEQEKILDSHK